MKVILRKQAEKRIKNGYPLIHQEDLLHTAPETSEWVDFVGTKGNFLGKGYLGKQNKGIGWVLTQKAGAIDEAFITQLFLTAKEKRGQLFNDELTTAFRVFNGEGDGFGGLTIDWYAGYIVFSWYNETIYQHRQLLINAFKKAYPEALGASEKIRYQSSLPESRWIFGDAPAEPLLVKENGVTYATYLNEGLMTGIFLDQKTVRNQLIQGLAMGKSVLNMFSYTGAFSVAAAMGGASSTTSVDLAKRSRSKTQEQFAVNSLPLEQQSIIVMDVFEYFKYAKRKGLSYDLIVLDPPSFARNKKKTFSVAKNYGELIADALPILNQEGQILASTNAANLSIEKFREMVEAEFNQVQVDFHLEQVFRLPADFATLTAFPEGNYLKVLLYQVDKGK